MTWVRPLAFLAAIICSEAIGVRTFNRHLLAWLFAVVIPVVLAGLWLILALQCPEVPPATPPRARSIT